MTELSDELLVAYVDGRLARDQTRAIDKVLVQDDVIAQRVEALKQAHGRLECAFEAILAGEVGEIMANTPAMPLPVARPRGNGLVKIGVATVVTGLALFALVAGYGWPLGQQPMVRSSAVKRVEMAPSTWRDEALRAQALLSRASVEVNLEGQGNFDLVAFQLAQVIGPEVKLPKLKPEGFKFMRAQLLRFDGKPLAQMLYLGTERAPLALYAMRGEGKARPLFRREGAIGSVSWTDDGIAYLLAGEEDEATLLRLAEKIKREPAATEPAPPRKLSDVSSGPMAAGAESIDPSAADPIITGSNPTMPSSPVH